MPNSMTFQKEGGYLVCYINGKEVSRAKVKSAGASEQDIIDTINEQIVANPVLSGTEPELTGFQKGEDKYSVGGTTVEANPQLEGGEPNLTSLLVGTGKYVVGGGSEVHLYRHDIHFTDNTNEFYISLYTANNTPFRFTTLQEYLFNSNNPLRLPTAGYLNKNGVYYNAYAVQGASVGISLTEGLYTGNSKLLESGSVIDTITQIF